MAKFSITFVISENEGKVTVSNVTTMSQGDSEIPLNDGLAMDAEGSRTMRITVFKGKRPLTFVGVKSLIVSEQRRPQIAKGPL